MAIIMATGHREIHNEEIIEAQVTELLRSIMVEPLVDDDTAGISGGAAGGDTLITRVYHDLNIPFHLELPNQYYWPFYKVPNCEEMYERARTVSYTVDRPTCDDWQRRWHIEKWWRDNFARNLAMVKLADRYVVLSNHHPSEILKYREIRGGTAACVRDIAAHGRGSETDDGKIAVQLDWFCPIDPEQSSLVTLVR